MDVEHGTELLLLAVRRDVGDLLVAHRVYDSLRHTLRCARGAARAACPAWLHSRLAAAFAAGRQCVAPAPRTRLAASPRAG